MKKRNREEYYVGLDIGTSSVGWAVATPDYRIPKFRGHKMWGSRLFAEGKRAAERRQFRTNRRRLARRRDRLQILEELFAEEMAKVDNTFFMRLKESKFFLEDKTVKEKHILFSTDKFDADRFYKDNPTIYHVRKRLMEEEPQDIRELFLAVHHILKYRGHFLFAGSLEQNGASIEELVRTLLGKQGLAILDDTIDSNEMVNILKNTGETKSDRKKDVQELWNPLKDKVKKAQAAEMAGLVLGLKSDISKLFANSDYKDLDSSIKNINFSSGDYEEKRDDYANSIGDDIVLLDTMKALYDTLILSQILQGKRSISAAKVEDYNTHKEQLRALKAILKPHKRLYNEMFRENNKKDLSNYVAYISSYSEGKRVNREGFYKYVQAVLKQVDDSDSKQAILEAIRLETFLPLLRVKDNAVIPHQIHQAELEAILETARKKYNFLNDVSDGVSVKDKIIQLFTFRIPYYVGPLNPHSGETVADRKQGTGWVVRKQRGKVYPWNFADMVDVKASAEAFITNLTNKCTYLIGEDVLPKRSLLYSEFMLLNELNMIKYDGHELPVAIKQLYIEQVFKQEHKKQTKGRVLDFLKRNGLITGSATAVITGMDDAIKGDLQSYRDMVRIFGAGFDHSMAERIIRWVTLFGEAKDILENKIREVYGNSISDSQMRAIKKLKYADWGRLSQAFLIAVKGCDKSGVERNIITCLRASSQNLMEILSDQGTYIKQIKAWNHQHTTNMMDTLDYQLVDDLYVAPSVKRSIWQSLCIVEELVKIMGQAPKKIFVEVTRTKQAEKTKKDSRKKRLVELYTAIGKEGAAWKKEIEAHQAGDFRRKKLYLYYTQMGRCMYSNEPIAMDALFTSAYDIDHIYPQSLTKDGSWDNLVLVKSQLNKEKSDQYPLRPAIREKNKAHWQYLCRAGFISEKKYERLMRTTELTAEELSGFIARQLVETSQATKAVTGLLERIYTNTEICFVKAETVSQFRHQHNFIKIRELNNYHHAKDAYLNIVVGNVYHEKFTKNPWEFIARSTERRPYNLNRMYDFDLLKQGRVIWQVPKSLETVQAMMKSNDVRITKKLLVQKGELYDATITKAHKAKEGTYFPLKGADARLRDVHRYGGYEKIKIAYYSVFSCREKASNTIHTLIIPIPVYKAGLLQTEADLTAYAWQTKQKTKPIKDIYSAITPIYKKLCINTVVKIDGFKYFLGGKTGDYMWLDPAIPVVLDEQAAAYLKAISKVGRADDVENTAQAIDLITAEANEAFYDVLLKKMEAKIFAKAYQTIVEKLASETARERFRELSIGAQCSCLLEILNLLANNKTTFTFFKDKMGVTMSRRKQPMDLTKLEECIVYETSITGLYEKAVSLL
ncbi:type II CRISPR RNA-guided endonuclease Cas9 [Megasphaera sp. UPII 135-E]|uniref:type II CRISPR RNA-guided endonuclease Cas9 n=1 Tax=Megasphaera sp. UPII 135-E TaxID=1000569 RepID=UPI00021A1DAC|nr:type II CRISPR RNA-guided endonuclease Cas9 [Megasphaera sp. UPII 135-E]EGS33886.1 CRISPR-associated protein, Csn1 family [Megasphaera sp. UPII 135-E]